jgi:hypothetical protein
MDSDIAEFVSSIGFTEREPRVVIPSKKYSVNIIALVKGVERYVYIYDDASRAETLRTLGRNASNPELSFTWYDAAVVSQAIRQLKSSCKPGNYSNVSYHDMKCTRLRLDDDLLE